MSVKVLVADTSALVRERLVAMLSEVKSIETITQAENASQTLGSVQRCRPDVVILDGCMSDHRGLEVVTQIKADSGAPVVIVLSQFPYPQYRARYQESGADFFLDKGTEIMRVVELITGLEETGVAWTKT
jgi:chemotaxis response regulator CheB